MIVLGFSSEQLLDVWDDGAAQSDIERPMTILARATARAPAELASLTLGTRDVLLMRVRDATFGVAPLAYAACPGCGESLELALDSGQFQAAAATPDANRILCVDDYTVQFQPPTTHDLAAAAACGTVAEARLAILRGCVCAASRRGQPVPADHLPDVVTSRLAEALAACDPLADILIELECPACHHRWTIQYDIGKFFWEEISRAARRLLHEVASLARLYGWSEQAILTMSPRRRQFYLAAT